MSSQFKRIVPNLLNPRERMPVNDLCWCKSGLKWKKCHRNRHLQTPEPIGKIIASMKRELHSGYCLHPEASENNCNKVIRAHTIQRNGGLSEITENGHIISPKKGVEDIVKNNGNTSPQEFGVKKASTFQGFCGFHDNKMFSPIEKRTILLCRETAFLLSFRAISYEFLTKESALKGWNNQKSIDKGQPFKVQTQVQNYIYIQYQGLQIGLKYIKKWKEKHDDMYLSKNYDNFEYYSIEFNEILPLVASGSFIPEVDCSGKRLQILTEDVDLLDTISMNITSFKGKSILVFGWIPTENSKSKQFAKSFLELREENKANMAFNIAIEQLENIYFKPSWWLSLKKNMLVEIEKRFDNGIINSRSINAYTNIPSIIPSLKVNNELYEF